MFSICSNEAKIQIINSSQDITEYKLINDNEECSIIQRKIYSGMYILFYYFHASIPQHQYIINQDMLAFHCCEKGIMNIKQNNQNIEIKNDSFCIHKVFKNSTPILVDMQNYSGITILFQIDKFQNYPHTIVDNFPSNLLEFWKNSNISPFLLTRTHSELAYVLSQLLKNKFAYSNISYLRIKIIEMILYFDNAISKDSSIYDKLIIENYDVIHEIKNNLEKNYNKKININQLCKKYGISNTSLKENFKKVYGKPIISYLREIRLANSLRFLEDESLSISQISQMVGYTNQSKFANAFKKRFAISPSEYRNYLKKIKITNNK